MANTPNMNQFSIFLAVIKFNRFIIEWLVFFFLFIFIDFGPLYIKRKMIFKLDLKNYRWFAREKKKLKIEIFLYKKNKIFLFHKIII